MLGDEGSDSTATVSSPTRAALSGSEAEAAALHDIQIAYDARDANVRSWMDDSNYLPSCEAKERTGDAWIVECSLHRGAYVDYSVTRNGVTVPADDVEQWAMYRVHDDGAVEGIGWTG